MNENTTMSQVRQALFAVAPDLEDETIDPKTPLRDQFDFDSMDFMRFVLELNALTGVEIPEADYPKLQTLVDCTDYLNRHRAP